MRYLAGTLPKPKSHAERPREMGRVEGELEEQAAAETTDPMGGFPPGRSTGHNKDGARKRAWP
jgi:hypothetical protein